MTRDKYDLIEKIALEMGKTTQDLANWRFAGKVPATLQLDVYLAAEKAGVDLTKKDLNNFKKPID